jgi:hypothetical protein
LWLQDVPPPVACRHVTFDIRIPTPLWRCPVLTVNGVPQPASLVSPDVARATLDLSQPVALSIGGSSQ